MAKQKTKPKPKAKPVNSFTMEEVREVWNANSSAPMRVRRLIELLGECDPDTTIVELQSSNSYRVNVLRLGFVGVERRRQGDVFVIRAKESSYQ